MALRMRVGLEQSTEVKIRVNQSFLYTRTINVSGAYDPPVCLLLDEKIN